MSKTNDALAQALWKVYRRPERPPLWVDGGNLPWNEPAFSERMLREHLDPSHGAASRPEAERRRQLDWLWPQLGLTAGADLLDVTCGPGLYAVDLAGRGCTVTGIDFGPAAVAHARQLAARQGVADHCTFIEMDVRQFDYPQARFDAVLFIYGQLAVFPPADAQTLLNRIAAALKPGGRLVVELLDQDRVDKTDSTWWYTDDSGLWGDAPFLHLGERYWDADTATSIERFQIIHLETGKLDTIVLCDQTYAVETMVGMMKRAGFSDVETYPAWNGLDLYDASEWVVYVAER